MAGDRDRAIHAYEQAIANYRRALDAVGAEEGRDQEKAAIYEKLGSCYDLARQFQNGIQSYEQALATFEKLRDFKSCARISPLLASAVYRVEGIRDALPISRGSLKYVEEKMIKEFPLGEFKNSDRPC